MILLVALSIIGLILFFERLFYLHKGHIRTTQFLEGIHNLLEKKRLLEALTLCEETPGPVAVMIKVALLNHDKPEGIIRTRLQTAALVEIPGLERRIGTIGTIAKIAPLLGLLGTVLALLQGFNMMDAIGNYAHVGDFSAIVSAALITTATGLAIAAIGHLAHHFLYGRVKAIVHDMEFVANDLLQLFSEGLFEEVSIESKPQFNE